MSSLPAGSTSLRHRSVPVASSILGIDPGPGRWAWAFLDGETVTSGVVEGDRLIPLEMDDPGSVVIERIMPRQQPLGHELLETIRTEARLGVAIERWLGQRCRFLTRAQVTAALIDGGNKAADSRIRAALIDRWGGGNPRSSGHPLHDVTGDCWAALAVAVAYREGVR